jgi:hypothetical protein
VRPEHGATLSKARCLSVFIDRQKWPPRSLPTDRLDLWSVYAALTYRLYLRIPEFWAGYQCFLRVAAESQRKSKAIVTIKTTQPPWPHFLRRTVLYWLRTICLAVGRTSRKESQAAECRSNVNVPPDFLEQESRSQPAAEVSRSRSILHLHRGKF